MPPKYSSIERKGKYSIVRVDKNSLKFAYGLAVRSSGFVFIRDDISGRFKDYVERHELYHLEDTYTWGGVFGAEIRADYVAMKEQPIGFIIALYHFFTSPSKMKRYLIALKEALCN